MEKQIIEILEKYQSFYGDQYGEIEFLPVEKFKVVAKEIAALIEQNDSNSAQKKSRFCVNGCYLKRCNVEPRV